MILFCPQKVERETRERKLIQSRLFSLLLLLLLSWSSLTWLFAAKSGLCTVGRTWLASQEQKKSDLWSHPMHHPSHHGVHVDGFEKHEHEAGQEEVVGQDGKDGAPLIRVLAVEYRHQTDVSL